MGLDIYFNKARIADAEKYQKEYESREKKLDELARVDWEEHPEAEEEYSKLMSELDGICPWHEVAYFRKVNFLLPFFEYEENRSDKKITKDEVELLINFCKEVLDKKAEVDAIHAKLVDNEEDNEEKLSRANDELEDLASELLPTTMGFFFGSYDYDEWYFECVVRVLDKFNVINENMDWENEILTMNCDW